jgi:hypothetical protein
MNRLGTICCRFAKGSDYLRNIGHIMQKHQLQSFQPYFRIREVMHEETAQRIDISPAVIEKMTKFAHFDIGSIAIPVSLQMGLISIELHLTDDRRINYPISGFPRSLVNEEPLKKTCKCLTGSIATQVMLNTVASPVSPELPPRPKISTKRDSLRKKRNGVNRRMFPNSSPGSSISEDPEYPENPGDVNDWVARRAAAGRAPPKPLASKGKMPVFELEGSTITDMDEDDEELAKAVERSMLEHNGFQLRRSSTGTDQEELARVLELSKIVK